MGSPGRRRERDSSPDGDGGGSRYKSHRSPRSPNRRPRSRTRSPPPRRRYDSPPPPRRPRYASPPRDYGPRGGARFSSGGDESKLVVKMLCPAEVNVSEAVIRRIGSMTGMGLVVRPLVAGDFDKMVLVPAKEADVLHDAVLDVFEEMARHDRLLSHHGWGRARLLLMEAEAEAVEDSGWVKKMAPDVGVVADMGGMDVPRCAPSTDVSLIITGPLAAVRQALGLAVSRISGLEKGEYLPPRHSSGARKGSGIPLDYQFVMYRMLCMTKKAGSIFGDRGMRIQTLAQETGARICASREVHLDNVRAVLIEAALPREGGRPLSPAREALTHLHRLIFREETDRSHVTARLLIAKPEYRELDRGGQCLAVERESGAEVRLVTRESRLPLCALPSDRLVEMEGTEREVLEAIDGVALALQKVQLALAARRREEAGEGGGGRSGAGASGAKSDDSEGEGKE